MNAMNDITGLMEEKDYLVSKFTKEGRKIEQGRPLAPTEANKLAEMVARHATGNGGRKNIPPTPPNQPAAKAAKAKKAVKKKAEIVQVLETPPVIPFRDEAIEEITPVLNKDPEPKTKLIVFHTPFGKIKQSVIDVLIHDGALCLVFNSEDDIRYMPADGTDVTMTLPDGSEYDTAYIGVTFTWSDGRKQLMLFMIQPKD